MKKLIIIILIFVNISSLQAKPFYSRVIKIRGKVSKLSPGQIHPSWIKKGDTLPEDTSILTRKKSFLIVKVLADNSTITLGPESKLVLNKLKKKKGSVVSLLTGTLRGKIDKINNAVKKGETKFIVRTRSAALGVRGTEFVTIVNNKNKVTSLVTLEGEVAMTKVEDPHLESETTEEIQKKLSEPEAVVVKKGRASTSYQHKEEVTKPQKVNPVQLIALKKNDEMDLSKKGKAVKEVKLTQAVKEELYGKNEDNSEEELEEAPTNGGFVDLKSAIFIPPTDDKKEALGSINSATGEYIPEIGVKLDPVKGFVAVTENKEDIKKAKDLNKVVSYKELPKDYAPGHIISAKKTSVKETYLDKNFYAVEFGIHTGKSTMLNTMDNKESIFQMKGGLVLNFLHKRPLTYNSAWSYGIHIASYDHSTEQENFSTQKDDIEEDTLSTGAHVGVDYMLAKNLIFSTKLIYQKDIFLVGFQRSSEEGLLFKQVSMGLKKFDISGTAPLFFKFLGTISYQSIFSAGDNSIYIESGKALKLSLKRSFGKTKKHYMKFSVRNTEYLLHELFYKNTDLKILYGRTF